MIRALETLSFGLFLLGWLLLGVFGTWTDTAPFWLGAPLLWLAAVCALFSVHRGLKGQLSRGCTVSVMLFTGYILWRALKSDVVYLARADIVFCATAFMGWVLTAANYEKPRHRFAMLVAWALLIVANLGLGLWQEYRNPQASALSFLDAKRDVRDALFGGFFPNSNHLCGFMELAAFPILGLAVFGRVHSFVRLLAGLVFVAAGVAVAMSTSRGGLAFWGGLLFFGALSGILHMRRAGSVKGRAGSTGVIFLVLAVVCSGVGWLTWNKLESTFAPQGGVFRNLNGRTELWSRAQEQWNVSPIIGTGARSYEYYEPKFRDLKTKWITWDDTDINARFAHNDWVQVLSDYGIIGLLLAAAVLGFHGWKALSFVLHDSSRAKREGDGFFTDYRGAITLGALCGMIAFAIHCMADFQMHIGINAVLAAGVLGLMANPGRTEAADHVETPSHRMPWRVAVTAAAAVPAIMLGLKAANWAKGDYKAFESEGLSGGLVEHMDVLLRAATAAQDAIEADPDNYRAWYFCGVGWGGAAQFIGGAQDVQRGFYRKAFEQFEIAHRLYPQNADISAYAARMLDAQQKYPEAEVWFTRALQWGNGSRLIHWWYADHLRIQGKYQDALDHYWPILHKHDYNISPHGFNKRTAIQKSIDYCNRKLEEARGAAQPPPAPAPTPPPP